jgi:hypothetical protein
VNCSTASYRAVLALAVPTFVGVAAAYPALCSYLLWQAARVGGGGEGRMSRIAPAAKFLEQPLRAGQWRALWAAPVRFGRKLLFPVLIGGASGTWFEQVPTAPQPARQRGSVDW